MLNINSDEIADMLNAINDTLEDTEFEATGYDNTEEQTDMMIVIISKKIGR